MVEVCISIFLAAGCRKSSKKTRMDTSDNIENNNGPTAEEDKVNGWLCNVGWSDKSRALCVQLP